MWYPSHVAPVAADTMSIIRLFRVGLDPVVVEDENVMTEKFNHRD